MNHRFPSRLAVSLVPLGLAMLLAVGCGEAFHATGGAGGGTSSAATGTGASVSASATSGSGGAAASSSVAATSSSVAATSTGSGATTCSWADSNPCANDKRFCDDPTCGSTPGAGVCRFRSFNTGHPGDEPVCGCDGFTYWNSNIATARGIALQDNVPCNDGVAVACARREDCSAVANARCRVLGGGCATGGLGICWVLPEKCDSTLRQAQSCEDKQCANECDLLQHEKQLDAMCN